MECSKELQDQHMATLLNVTEFLWWMGVYDAGTGQTDPGGRFGTRPVTRLCNM